LLFDDGIKVKELKAKGKRQQIRREREEEARHEVKPKTGHLLQGGACGGV